jgi:hypothetical protein
MAHELESVRSELRRLGYLNHRFERSLLQDALRPRQPLVTVAHLAARVAVAGGGALALVTALALATANGNLSTSPFDLIPLFFHLLPGACLVLGLGFVVLCGAFVLLLRWRPVRRIEALSLGSALVAGGGVAALAVWRLRPYLDGSSRVQVTVLAVVTVVLTFAVIQMIHSGLLGFAIRLTESPPRRRLFSRRWIAGAVFVGLFLVMLPAVLAVQGAATGTAPRNLPRAEGERVLLVGIDGILAEEVEYLLARGRLPALGALVEEGGTLWRYARPALPPAVFWTSVATGRSPAEHGVVAVDSFRPWGVTTPLARTGPLRPYWRLERALGLTEYRPLLANRRHAFTVWELASRGGTPVLAVNWWATFPADALPGAVVAHGAYALLEEGVEGALAGAVGAETAALLATLRDARLAMESQTPRAAEATADRSSPLVALPAEERDRVEAHALAPDRFHREAFRRGLAVHPRLAALYLPAVDLAADGWRGSDLAFADLVREQLEAVDRLIATHGDRFDTIAVVLDPGRRRGAEEGEIEGRVLFRSTAPCAGAVTPIPRIEPQQIAAALLRLSGLPQSRALPQPPAGCPWPTPPDTVDSYGPRTPAAAPLRNSAEYLENLRSLGYL